MPRQPFRLASNSDGKTVDCFAFDSSVSPPVCRALNRPYCLGPGGSPDACGFRRTRDDYAADQRALAARRAASAGRKGSGDND